MPAPKTLREQLDDALESGGGATAIERAIVRGVRARRHDVHDAESRELIRGHVAEKFAFSADGKRAWALYQGRTIDAAEGVRQVVNAVCVQLETEPDPDGQELTPLEQVQAKGKASGRYSF